MDMMGLVWDIQGLGPEGVLYFFYFFYLSSISISLAFGV